MSEQLTVIIPCKNEEKNIRACVESVHDLADELVIADSLSTDSTLAIVRAIGGCRIIQREFLGYADFKNWAISQATHRWVLLVDADERVPPELSAEIRDILAEPRPGIDGYWIYRRNFFMGHELRYGGWNTDDVCRLIHRDRCRYANRPVHEEIDISRKRSAWLKHRLLHYSYWNYDQFFGKRVRYTRLNAGYSWAHGKRATTWSLLVRPFLRFCYLYFVRLGFLDGKVGIQACTLNAYFNTFFRQARLWEMEHAGDQPDPDARDAAVNAAA